jgi:hypothetical protein
MKDGVHPVLKKEETPTMIPRLTPLRGKMCVGGGFTRNPFIPFAFASNNSAKVMYRKGFLWLVGGGQTSNT